MNFKNIWCLILILVTSATAMVQAQTFTSADGKINFKVTSAGAINTVSASKHGYPSGTVIIPDSVVYNSTTYLVTSIPYYGFENCSGIDSLSIGRNIEYIGYCAFSGCTGIASPLVIPDNVRTIKQSAFLFCSKIPSLTIGRGVTSIEPSAFDMLDGLKEVYFNATNCADVIKEDSMIFVAEEIYPAIRNYYGGKYSFHIGSNVTRIPAYLCYQCPNISSITFEGLSQCKEVRGRSFFNAQALETIAFPNSVTRIGPYAFTNCINLSAASIPNSLVEICQGAFLMIRGSFNVDPENPAYTSMDGVLYNKNQTTLIQCPVSKNGEFNIPDKVTMIGRSAFIGCAKLSKITIPNSVTEISDYAFSGCSLLDRIPFPSTVAKIGNYVFSECNGFISLVIPNTITSIGKYAFFNCGNLREVTIPNSVSEIEFCGFYGCGRLTTIKMQGSTPPSTDMSMYGAPFSMFVGVSPRAKLYVPMGARESYRSFFKEGFDFGKNIIEADGFCSSDGLQYIITDAIQKKMMVMESTQPYVGNIAIPSKVSHGSEIYSVDAIGGDAFSNCPNLSSVSIPNSIKNIGDFAFSRSIGLTDISIPDSVVSLGANAFQGCSGLTTVSIGNSVKTINDYTFQACSNLMDVKLGKSVKSIGDSTFQACSKLISIDIPDSLVNIGPKAFQDCSALKTIDLGKSVESLGRFAFQNCKSLSSCNLPKRLKKIDANLFQACSSLASINIPDSVTAIGDSAFADCSSLASVVMDNRLSTIGAYAFTNCSSLNSISIPDEVAAIGNYAFADCNGLASIVMGNRLSTIGAYAFSNCGSLNSISIPDSVTAIGDYAFAECNGLASVVIGRRLSDIGAYAFSNCSNLASIQMNDALANIGTLAFQSCSSLKSITIPEPVTSIGDYAFYNCKALQTINLNAINCAYMGKATVVQRRAAFYGCTSLNLINVGEKVAAIPKYAFYQNNSLTTITGCKSLSFIGFNAFASCSKLNSIAMETSTPPVLEATNVFLSISPDAKLYVPAGSKAAYIGYNTNTTYTRFFSSSGSSTDGARIIEGISGINEQNSLKCIVYGNSSQQVVISNIADLRGTASAYDLTGHLLISAPLEGSVTTLPKRLAPNVYMVIVEANGRIKKEKVVIR